MAITSLATFRNLGFNHPQLYSPLDYSTCEIRLLHIQDSANVNDDIECTLSTASLDDQPKYVAVSYAWGDPKRTSPILLQGVLFEVTFNLKALLKRIRENGEEVPLWVDAVCINQANTSERSAQVQLMRDIFAGACSVLAWLGEESSDSMLAVSFIRGWHHARYEACILENGSMDWAAFYKWEDHQSNLPKIIAHVKEPFDKRSWDAAHALFRRPYWSRAWVAQELAMARKVIFVCGADAIYLNEIESVRVLEVLFRRSGPSTFTVEEMSMAGRITEGILDARRFYKDTLVPGVDFTAFERACIVLRLTWDLDATDPRDKIFALMGLAGLGVESGFRFSPDYELSISQVFSGFVRVLAEHTGKLFVNGCNGFAVTNAQPIPGLPSWAPDFRKPSQILWRENSYRAAGDTTANARFFQRNQVLLSSGVIVDIVKHFEPPLDWDHHAGWEDRVRWHNLVRSQEELAYPAGISQWQAYARTILRYTYNMFNYRMVSQIEHARLRIYQVHMGFFYFEGKLALESGGIHPQAKDLFLLLPSVFDALQTHPAILGFVCLSGEIRSVLDSYKARGLDGVRSLSDKEFINDFCGFKNSVVPIDNLDSGATYKMLENYTLASMADSYTSTLKSSCLVTNRGYIGISPCQFKTEDKVCVLMGCDFPLLIRPVDDHFIVLGSCYVYGIMHGEVLKDIANGKLQWESFNLR